MSKRRRSPGFTLIELLIVVVVLGILTAVALPSYLNQVRKARRADAMDALEKVLLAEAKWRANHTSYTSTMANLSVPATSVGGYYSPISIISAATTTFTATATATGSQAHDKCGNFKVNHDGPVVDDASFADAECWRR